MSQLSGIISCPQIQGQLNEFWATCDPTKIREGTVLQDFLYSEANAIGGSPKKMTERVSPGGGKVRQVEYIYSPRILESEVAEDTGRDDCTSSNQIGETSTVVTIPDSYVQADFYVSPFELKTKCMSNELYFAEKLQQTIDAVVRKRETKLFNAMELMYGGFSAGEPDVTAKVKSVATRQTNPANLDADAMAQIGISTRYAGYCAPPVVFGGREMGDYMRKLNAGCCYTEGGYDIGGLLSQYGMAFLESYRADDSFGTDGFMTVQPGAMQLVEYLEYEGTDGQINTIDSDLLKLTVIMDPRTGARFDLKINVDCNGVYHVFVRSYFKLITLPVDMFYAGDRLNGVNFLNRFQIVNP